MSGNSSHITLQSPYLLVASTIAPALVDFDKVIKNKYKNILT